MVKFWGVDDLVRYGDAAEKHGRQQEIIANMDRVLDHQLQGDEETALIITDTDVSPTVYHVLAGQLSSRGITPTVSIMPLTDAPNKEPPVEIAEAAKTTDLIVNMCRYSISHTQAITEAQEEGDPTYLLLADPTEDYFRKGAITADPDRLNEFNAQVASIIHDGEWVEVTSELGTDVEMSIEGRTPIVAEYPLGESPLCPVEETVNGTVVHDSFMMGIGILDEPITWEIEDGRIVEISGGREAVALENYVDERGDDNAYWIGEFSVQSQHAARPNGNYIEHKQVKGGVHFAMGTGEDLGGHYVSNIHLDGIQLEPTVTVDGHTIVAQGEFDHDVVDEIADPSILE